VHPSSYHPSSSASTSSNNNASTLLSSLTLSNIGFGLETEPTSIQPARYVPATEQVIAHHIIAYPDKIQELLEQWRGGRDCQVSRRNAGLVRTGHASVFKSRKTTDTSEFFYGTSSGTSGRNESDILGRSIYPVTLPARQ
jgi:hypothetical protein